MIIEVCANSVQSAINAEKAGAKRIELCDNMYEGGTTPSYGCIELCREKLDIDVNVIIRPRGGDFLYSDDEFQIMKKDIEACKRMGVNGVVFGILNSDGTVDVERNKELWEVAQPMSCSFHRAFDVCLDAEKAMEEIISIGFDRILTAGQTNNAIEGIELLAKLQQQAGKRIVIMPGSGVNHNNIVALKEKIGTSEFHLSGKVAIYSKMQYRKPNVNMMGVSQIPEYEMNESSVEKIKKAVEQLTRDNK
jgi:copper homeostasis protein